MSESSKRASGRKEVLTLELARKIVSLIERMPDVEVAVNWVNIELHVKKKFGHNLKRNVLSSKEFDGRKLIHEAYTQAIDVQRRLQKQATPKYANTARAGLRNRILLLEAKILALQQELASAHLAQLTKLDLYRATRLDLRELVESAKKKKHDTDS